MVWEEGEGLGGGEDEEEKREEGNRRRRRSLLTLEKERNRVDEGFKKKKHKERMQWVISSDKRWKHLEKKDIFDDSEDDTEKGALK